MVCKCNDDKFGTVNIRVVKLTNLLLFLIGFNLSNEKQT